MSGLGLGDTGEVERATVLFVQRATWTLGSRIAQQKHNRVDVRVGHFFRCLSFQERAVCAVPLALSAWPDLRPRIM